MPDRAAEPPAGPLTGVRVVELAGIGPGPFAAMMLADMGADVTRVDRAAEVRPDRFGTPHPDLLNRGRRSIGVDLKADAGRRVVLDLVRDADVLLEGFRPGVTERLGLGPAHCHEVNPRLVYGRMTGWGQDGPNAGYAGHDLTYLAPTGILHAIGRAGERPVPPLNLIGDFGGGGMMLAFGVVCALFEAHAGGPGQVVDAAIVDGATLLSTALHGLRGLGMWPGGRGGNLLDGGAPFYDTYECADGRYVAVGALEPRFYAELLARTGFRPPSADQPARTGLQPLSADQDARFDPENWAVDRAAWAELFGSRTRDEWAALLEHGDACVAPVLDWDEAPEHPHLRTRGVFVTHAGAVQPAPAPRFSRTPAAIRRPPPHPGEHTDKILTELGRSPGDIAQLREHGAVA